MRLLCLGVAAIAAALALAGCVGQPPDPAPGDTAPIGPVAPQSGPVTLDRVLAIVGEDDASPTTLYTADGTLSTSGADLESEGAYFAQVGGTPPECAGVVSSPYLVSALDTGARADDPSALIGTFTEVDEDRFGLVQVYARQFDDAATASGFLAEFAAAVQACPGYRFVDAAGAVTWNATGLTVAPLDALPTGVAGVQYHETVTDTDATAVTTAFLQRDGVVIAVYGELYPSSTITPADVQAVATAIAGRLAVL
jgi:hypothetical protein